MEIGIKNQIPTYSGGLGILAGDTLKAAADLGVPIIGITLLSEHGYFTQHLDEEGNQTESPTDWNLHEQLGDPLPERANVQIEGRNVQIQAWQYWIEGSTGSKVPVLFLDTNLEENEEQDRALTAHLYGGDRAYRLKQEVVLGIGGVRMLRALNHTNVYRYHMNEGHASLLALELFREDALKASCPLDDFDACMQGSMADIRKFCVFTTHTPVAAGHDKFPYDMVQHVLGEFLPMYLIKKLCGEDELNMTLLAMNLSHYVNSVAKQHQQVSTHLFPGYQFSSITNGVHSTTWTGPHMAALFDSYIPNWRQDSFELRYASRIPEQEILQAHQSAKEDFVNHVNEHYQAGLDKDVFTIGFARRATAYKRMHLLFQNIDRLRAVGSKFKLQIVYAGKAHPADGMGKDLIKMIYQHASDLQDTVKVVFLPNYDIHLASKLIAGVDIWLNTPVRPLEASGTSGMKAAHNGVPQFSILDGWWIEGHTEGMTGWSIGPMPSEENENSNDDGADAEELYDKLEHIILPMFYEKKMKWEHVMRNSIAFNGSFFNTHRMVQQYALNAWLY